MNGSHMDKIFRVLPGMGRMEDGGGGGGGDGGDGASEREAASQANEDKSMKILKRIYGAMDGDGEGGVAADPFLAALRDFPGDDGSSFCE